MENPGDDPRTPQYNVAVKVVDPSQEEMVQYALRPYRVFTDRSGNLKDTCFSKESLPYIGEVVVVKTLNQKAAETAHRVLSGIEGLLTLPIHESVWEKDQGTQKSQEKTPLVS